MKSLPEPFDSAPMPYFQQFESHFISLPSILTCDTLTNIIHFYDKLHRHTEVMKTELAKCITVTFKCTIQSFKHEAQRQLHV